MGSAASAVQKVPSIASQMKELFVFQRTPNWFYPRLDLIYSDTVKHLFKRISLLMTIQRVTLFILVEGWAAIWLTKVDATGFDIEGSICGSDTYGRNKNLLREGAGVGPSPFL
jgi:cation diffusion facilitator CzcD-associated flavoprotein CzcO